LANVAFLEVIGHAETAAGIEVLLDEEETVLAIQIADGPRGLGQDVKI
jgi:hypothetical protein